ncbi:dihydroxyacetone kinase subunit L [Isoptericola sp. S6320L]|uniref:dihydroxyacetone kinase subunit DhaL n=1 Tax=Isoptericola sp. S6320L TaxID=2926411 RepID=UPI001FF59E2E|nr:dihydroxyacetone kinase subunit DhaL [Isoptericola sp. S6320L]MCK0117092.1 dihydroxyacetone kinase subunit L [Isoptericola sp. S6320L]
MHAAAADVRDARDELTELDRRIGDGDHGVNMDRGLSAVVERLDDPAQAPRETVGQVLRLAATTMMSTVGGAAGPLYGTALLRASKVTDRADLPSSGVVALVEAALEGIVARGRATVGEKTMVDAWQPAAEAAEQAEDAEDGIDVLRAAAAAAATGAEATIPLVATKGRASYLAERSAGTQDPGARSTAIILAAAVAAAEGRGA